MKTILLGEKNRRMSISNLDTNNEKWQENVDVCSFKKMRVSPVRVSMYVGMGVSVCVLVFECVRVCVGAQVCVYIRVPTP